MAGYDPKAKNRRAQNEVMAAARRVVLAFRENTTKEIIDRVIELEAELKAYDSMKPKNQYIKPGSGHS